MAQTSGNENAKPYGETSSRTISRVTKLRVKLLSGAATQMVHCKPRLLFCYAFFACKFLKIMYLFGPRGSVDLMDQFSVTEKTRHYFEDPHAPESGSCLTRAAHGAYKQR